MTDRHKPCACSPDRPCLLHYDTLSDYGKRLARDTAGVSALKMRAVRGAPR